MGTEPRFVVVGSGRSGTGFIAHVLTAAGIPTGHEAWWNPLGERQEGLVGDASWCAVPELAKYDGLVWHQTRHPLAVIASLAAAPLWGPYAELAAPFAESVPEIPYAREAALWVFLNLACENYATRCWQVEEVDAELVEELGGRIGVPVSSSAALEAVSATSVTTNAHHEGRPIMWGDLPDLPVTACLVGMARRYGYLP